MNLKEAARQLGVHYQTAYKWVRSGELVAVRVGARYEVSPAAIDRFQIGRRSVVAGAVPSPVPPLAKIEPEDVLEALEAMAVDPFVTLRTVATMVARRGAEVLGDVCVVAHCDESDAVDFIVVDHPDPDEGARLAGALLLTEYDPASAGGLASTAYAEQRIIRVPHVPQDWVRRAVRPELLQHLALHPIHSLLVAPILEAGRSAGVLVFTRGESSRPFSAADEQFVGRLAVRVGALFETALEVGEAWTARKNLVAALTDVASRTGNPPSLVDLVELIERCAGRSGLPVAVLDGDGYLLAVNSVAEDLTGRSLDAVIGMHFESFTHPDELAQERSSFARLRSGELDYLDIHARRRTAQGAELAYASQRAAVRDPDATLRFVVSIARPLHIAKEDYTALLTEPREASSPNS